MIAGLIGGTVSQATGGKFANGAIQSAIQWNFNAERLHLREKTKQQIIAIAKLRQAKFEKMKGLQWFGSVRSVSGGEVGVASFLMVDLTSEWKAGVRYNVKLRLFFVGVGAGMMLEFAGNKILMSGPNIFGESMVAISFDGLATYVGVGASLIAGTSYSKLTIGLAQTDLGFSFNGGFNASVSMLVGEVVGDPVVSKQNCSDVWTCGN